LAVFPGLDQRGIHSVGHESAFHQNPWYGHFSQDHKARPLRPSVACQAMHLRHFPVDQVGQQHVMQIVPVTGEAF
jgi:hypothetical protein